MAELVTKAQNSIYRDVIRHMVDIERLKAGQVKQANLFIKEMMDDIISQVYDIDMTAPKLTKFQRMRLERLAKEGNLLLASTYKDLLQFVESELVKTIDIEQRFTVGSLNDAIFGGVNMVKPTLATGQMRSIVRNRQIFSTPAREWWQSQVPQRQAEFRRTLNVALAQGETNNQIVKRLREKGGFEDKTRKQVTALVRTETQNILNDARLELYRENKDVVAALEHNSTLDNRTTDICISRDGLKWVNDENLTPIGHNVDFENPPLHFQCRSVIMSVLEDYAVITGSGKKYSEAKFESELRKNFTRPQGESKADYDSRIQKIVDRQRDRMTTKTESSQRQPTDFLRSDPAAADKILGKRVAELFREGRFDLKDIISAQTQRPMSSDEIIKKYGG